VDGDSSNDFLGKMLTAGDELIVGELDRTWAGGGGGAGGDAVNFPSFPLVPFIARGDEKGAGGGGGAGGLRILALGPITIVAPTGTLAARGGQGGGGENTNFFDRVGGGSAGGSGGHIVVSSASYISIEGNALNSGSWYNDLSDDDREERMINARGGQGGAGHANKGGAIQNGRVTDWDCDAIPFHFFLPNLDPSNPPWGLATCWNLFQLPGLDDLEGGPVNGAGGDGTPGMIQFHVDNPVQNLRFPNLPGVGYGLAGNNGIDASRACMPPPVGWKARELNVASDLLIPFFGKESTSQSLWIPLGLARVNPAGGTDQVLFRFEGTNPGDGIVQRMGPLQALLPAIVGPADLGSAPNPPYIEAGDSLTMVLNAAGLVGEEDAYKQNPYYFPYGMGNNGSDFTVGAVLLKRGMGNFFKGQIGGLAVYNRALTDAEMKGIGEL
jgi:hypothetical protein